MNGHKFGIQKSKPLIFLTSSKLVTSSKGCQTNHTISVFFFLVNLDDSQVCQIYKTDKSPVILQFLDNTVVACGEFANKTDKSCFGLKSDGRIVEKGKEPSMLNEHCPHPEVTRSLYIDPYGLFVFGRKPLDGTPTNDFDTCEHQASKLTSERFQLDWRNESIVSPYPTGNYPSLSCSVALNTSHVMVIGGYVDGASQQSCFILNLDDNTWSPTAPMPDALYLLQLMSCGLSQDGEVVVAGGYQKDSKSDSVYKYNPASNNWTQSVPLPVPVGRGVMLSWNNTLILLPTGNDTIYEMKDDGSWELMKAKLGARFDSQTDLAVIVPEQFGNVRLFCPS